MSNEFLIYW